MASPNLINQAQQWTSAIPGAMALKRTLHNNATACGLTLWLSGLRDGTGFAVVSHHRVLKQPDPYYSVHYSVAQSVFEAQLAMFSRFCAVLPLDEIIRHLEEGHTLPKRCVALTFDDGYREMLTLIQPLLRRYRLPATLFVTVEALERGFLWPDLLRYAIRATAESRVVLETVGENPLAIDLSTDADRLRAVNGLDAFLKQVPNAQKQRVLDEVVWKLLHVEPAAIVMERIMLSWEELEVLASDGVAIGSHTLTHPILTHISEEEAAEEIAHSRRTLQARLGRAVDHFAYPNGRPEDYSPAIQRLVASAGFRSACTTVSGINRVDTKERFALKRINGAERTLRELVRVIEETSSCRA